MSRNILWLYYLSGILLLITDIGCKNASEIMRIEKKLRDDLFKNYDPHVRPVRYSSDVIKMEINLWIDKIVEVNEETQTIAVDSFVLLLWNDYYLKWDKNDYNGIDHMFLPAYKFWIPDIFEIRTGGPGSAVTEINVTHIYVDSSGLVWWDIPAMVTGRCEFNYNNYPHDTAECKFAFELWTYKGDAVDVVYDSYFYPFTIAENDPHWTAGKMYAEIGRYNGTYPIAYFKLALSRNQPTPQQQLQWITSVIVILLTLCMFWIPADVRQKLTIGCVMMVMLTATLIAVSSSVQTPEVSVRLASTIHTTMFVVTVAILFEIIVINLQFVQEHKPPEFLLHILSGTIGRVFCITSTPKDDSSVDKMKLSEYEDGDILYHNIISHENWQTISRALDRVLFFVYVIILIAIPKTT